MLDLLVKYQEHVNGGTTPNERPSSVGRGPDVHGYEIQNLLCRHAAFILDGVL